MPFLVTIQRVAPGTRRQSDGFSDVHETHPETDVASIVVSASSTQLGGIKDYMKAINAGHDTSSVETAIALTV